MPDVRAEDAAGLTFEEEGHRYLLDGVRVPSVTQILALGGLSSWDHIPPQVLEAARLRGTAVHLAVQLYLEDDLDWSTVSEGLKPYLDAYQEFQAGSGFVPDRVEHRLVHRVLRFAGTPDQAGPFKGGRAIVELKSGGIVEAAAFQTAGQAILEQQPFCRRFGLELKPNGRPRIVEFTDPTDRHVFLAALTIAHRKLRNGGPR